VKLDLHYRHLRARRAVRGAFDAFAQWVFGEWACATCGYTSPRKALTRIYPHGLLCRACMVGHIRGHFATLERP
jgi:hypothetical protein